MKRLVVTGLPCPPSAWQEFLGDSPNQRIVSMFDVLTHSRSSDLREMAHYVEQQITAFQPQSIVCHGFGVSLTLLSLLRLRRRGFTPPSHLTLMNGAIRRITLFSSPHPLRIQWTTQKRLIKEIYKHGGQVDIRLERYLPRIRAMYRLVMLFNLAEAVSSKLQFERFLGLNLSAPIAENVQLIASPNDPYIPYSSIVQLIQDFRIQRFFEIEYGHFPYSVDPSKIVPLINTFEAEIGRPYERPTPNTTQRLTF